MKMNRIATATLMASVALSPISPFSVPARADGKDVVAGLIIGGIIGSAVTKDNNKKKKSTVSASTSSAQREENIEVQTALNYFGYNVGTPDGAIGPKSRAAISEYQAFLGYPATGELTESERTILVTAYQRALAGGAVIAETVSASPHGLKAVLITQRDEMAGVAPATSLASGETAPAPGSVAEAAAAALPRLVPETVAEEVPVEEAEVVTAAADAEPALPSFMDPSGANGSLAAECDTISLATAGNGGPATASTMQDASFALGEQFCLARSYAMASSDALTAQLASFTPEQISEQCAAFGPVLKEHVTAVSLKSAAEVLTGVEGFVLSSGMSPAQLSGTAKVCLGAGYAQDDMSVAMGSALLLVAMGERAYSEYLGHHLSQGFGATERPDLAMDWYQMALDAMDQGQMVVAPEVQDRGLLIQKASYTINGRADELDLEPDVQEAALPVFEVVPEEIAAEEVASDTASAEVILPATEVEEPATELDLAAEYAAAEAEVIEEMANPVPEEVTVVVEAAPEVAVTETTDLASATPEVMPEAVAEVDLVEPAGGINAQMAILALRLPLMILTAY